MNDRYQICLGFSGKFEILDTHRSEWIGGEFDTYDAAIAFASQL